MKYLITLVLANVLMFNVSLSEASNKKSKQSQEKISDSQVKVLKLAYDTAQKDGLSKPIILSGIIMQESGAGTAKNFRTSRHKKAKDQTTGLGQIKVGTAAGVIKKHPELKAKMSSNNLPHEIAYNDKFNIAVASLYLKDLSEECKSEDALITAYNVGHCAKGHSGYVRLVKRHYETIKRII